MASGESTYKEALGAMIVSSKTRRMLLQLRSRNKIWGFFGGKKAGNPARALTAAMFPFILIATISLLATSGALPPGSGPNDVAVEISEIMGHEPGKDALGPISKKADSNCSVIIFCLFL